MNAWLWTAAALIALMVPLVGVAAWRRPLEGLIALEVVSTLGAVGLLVLAEGTNRQPFADLAVALGLVSFAGALAILRFIEEAR